MSEQFLYLNILPVRTAEEVGGFGPAETRKRGVAVATTLSSADEVRHFPGDQCESLVSLLGAGPKAVGFNCLRFDFELIRGEVPFVRPRTLDLMDIIRKEVGHRVSLHGLARATFGRAGIADSEDLRVSWASGDRDRVLRAMKRTLTVMRRLHEHMLTECYVMMPGENGSVDRVELPRLRRPRRENEAADDARRSMLDQAVRRFSSSAELPPLYAVQNAGTGRAGVSGLSPDCENGMVRLVGKIRTVRSD